MPSPPTKESSSQEAPLMSPSRLSRFIDELSIRPNDPPHDLEEPNFRASVRSISGLASAPSFNSSTNPVTAAPAHTTRNPEADSFAYMETLLESLAVLGKLGSALDMIAQRLPAETFSLVENTLEEAGERAEYGRRGSMLASACTGVQISVRGNRAPGFTPEESLKSLR